MREWQRKRVVGLVRCECCVCVVSTLSITRQLSGKARGRPRVEKSGGSSSASATLRKVMVCSKGSEEEKGCIAMFIVAMISIKANNSSFSFSAYFFLDMLTLLLFKSLLPAPCEEEMRCDICECERDDAQNSKANNTHCP